MDDEIKRLVELAEELGLEELALDEMVHLCAQDEILDELNNENDEDEQENIIANAEDYACDINNGGLENQIAYLLEHNDVAWVEGHIRKTATEDTTEKAFHDNSNAYRLASMGPNPSLDRCNKLNEELSRIMSPEEVSKQK